MSIRTVENHTIYWKNSSPPPWTIGAEDQVNPVGGDKSIFNSDLETLYTAPAGAAMLDALTSNGMMLRIAGTSAPSSAYRPGFAGSDEYAAFNMNLPNILQFVSTQGTVVADTLLIDMAHELTRYQGHGSSPDPASLPDSTINSGGYDFYGPAITQQNTIMSQLGHNDLLQAGYGDAGLGSYWSSEDIFIGLNYTHNQSINVARFGDDSDNTLSMDAYGSSK